MSGDTNSTVISSALNSCVRVLWYGCAEKKKINKLSHDVVVSEILEYDTSNIVSSKLNWHETQN